MGESWSQLNSGGWQSAIINDLKINSAGKIFAAAGNAVYVSSDNGNTWVSESSGLIQNTYITNLAFDKNEFLYGTTYYYGIFKSVRSTLTSVSSTFSDVDLNYRLEQNYPNPFNPKTIINYELGITNFVTLKIYDVLGNEVATLINEKQNSGSYSVNFDGANLPSGIYFYKLDAGNFSEVKKMTLLK